MHNGSWKVGRCSVANVASLYVQEEKDSSNDAWSRYMQEVNRYRSNICIEEDSKTRPLMKWDEKAQQDVLAFFFLLPTVNCAAQVILSSSGLGLGRWKEMFWS